MMVRAIVRPEKADKVLENLMAEGFPAVTRMNVSGRGRQRGIKIGDITYDGIPKELLIIVVPDAEKDMVIKTVIGAARTGANGAFGDGKIFVSPVEEVYTVSSGIKETDADKAEGARMKEVVAIIRMNKINQTKEALIDAEISSLHVRECLGRGKGVLDFKVLKGAEQGYEEAIAQLGNTQRLIPKRMLSVVVPDKLVNKVAETIISANRTRKPGDGKIFVMPISESIRIRTAETGDETLDFAK